MDKLEIKYSPASWYHTGFPHEREENAGKNVMISCTFTRIGTVYNSKYQSEFELTCLDCSLKVVNR
jgi:hypothetical protein